MGEDAYLEMAFEDANGGSYNDPGYDLYTDHECDDAYETGECAICGFEME